MPAGFTASTTPTSGVCGRRRIGCSAPVSSLPSSNAFLLGAGADVWGTGTLTSGIVAIALIIPVFVYRHYIQDKGQFPAEMLADLSPDGKSLGEPKAGFLPYATLGAGIVAAVIGYVIFLDLGGALEAAV